MTADMINGAFEFLSGGLMLLNVAHIVKDKVVRGVSIIPSIFFSLWGAWNLWYYPHLGQYWSFIGGLFIFAVNTIWILLVWYYKGANHEKKTTVSNVR